MREVSWNKVGFFEKIIFIFGWMSVGNLLFWLIILISFIFGPKKDFWKNRGYKVVYVFGWINLVSFILLIIMFMSLTSQAV